jgi:hypothetical protein
LIFSAVMIIGLLSISMILQFTVLNELNMQRSMAMDEKKNYQQKISQHNECKGNSTQCTNVGPNGISISINPQLKQKSDSSKQANSNYHNSKTYTPLLLPFP